MAVGGGLGACARYALSTWVMQLVVPGRFPWGTFIVNVLGCLVAGLLLALGDKLQLLSAEVRLFLFTGILCGFTTFSAFGVETIHLLRRDEITIALAYVGLSVLCGLAALWLAYALVPGKGA